MGRGAKVKNNVEASACLFRVVLFMKNNSNTTNVLMICAFFVTLG